MTTKSGIRRSVLRSRDAISAADKDARNAEIKTRLLHLRQFRDATKVMFYASFRSEPETLTIIADALGSGKLVALPKVDMLKRQLDIYEIRHMAELVSGCMNIPEPDVSQSRRIDTEQLSRFDLIVMPGVAFDTAGGRLGYGGGFYDRLLSSMQYRRPLLVALAYAEQMVDDIPMQEHDVRVDIIITDTGIIRPALQMPATA
ncbi:MAG: 5-formyltetrahydrofolate cyclo-ligase [Nitrospirae bacterium]|uniref:5-formyltetrahydrofolate cyclo-ligase n=1 Tax=Candidatus Magnetobacterium casense TaxID=1455061 RepID=UPI00058C482E|nr:5-formyltetrahydrofolate cyclo-ligase [Candidatus Magnetobacterium casensis]MBF0339199.1 5-formyltetrahydrofolate cyclo-ligase [Nitrospirota bacterium]